MQGVRLISRTCMRGACSGEVSTASLWTTARKSNVAAPSSPHRVAAMAYMRSQTPSMRAQVDFYDRSVLGEGIHCLKCGSFVNLPRDGDPMVQCPYCAYRWCVRCKCPSAICAETKDIASNRRYRRDAHLTRWLNSTQVAPEYQV